METQTYEFLGIRDIVDIASNQRDPSLLILDARDCDVRQLFQRHSPHYNITWVHSVKAFLRVVSEMDFDLISMEHDLTEPFEDPDSPTSGMAVVRYLEKTGWPVGKRRPRIHIHTRNIFAARLMVTRLNAMGFFAEWEPLESREITLSGLGQI